MFGGRSPEHEISIISAKTVYSNIDKEKYDVVLTMRKKVLNNIIAEIEKLTPPKI